MSYEKVRSLSIRNGKISITSSSNNVAPLYYTRWEYTHGMREFLREISGRTLQIQPSANKYRWVYVHDEFDKELKNRFGIQLNDLYTMKDDDELWGKIVELYFEKLKEANEVKNDKYVVKYNGDYAKSHAYGKRYYVTTNRDEAMRIKAWEARNWEISGWIAEKVVF